MKVNKIKFIAAKKELSLSGLSIDYLFKGLDNHSISTIMKSSWVGLKKIKVMKILLRGVFRKFNGKPGITVEMRHSVMPYISQFSDEEIKSIEVTLENSGKVVFETSNIKISELLWDIRDVIINNQYNVLEETLSGKTVVDCGANKGVFSLFAVLLGAKKVYSFEPVSSTNDNFLKTIALNKMGQKIILSKKALGKSASSGKISSRRTGDGGAQVNSSFASSDGWMSENIKIDKLDNFSFGKIDFIKMDTEGYEAEILEGAKEIIKKYKPILSFSAYHKPGDKKKLPEMVKSIRNDYKIKLNNFAEEVFYCS